MKFQILSIFPELFAEFSRLGLVGRACADGLIEIECRQLRDFAINSQGQIDDTPYGGGSGMLLRVEPAVAAIEEAKKKDPSAKVVLMTPRGKPLTQKMLRELTAERVSANSGVIFLCSRYEGVDERVAENWVDLEVSVGDFIAMGGEAPTMMMIESMTRLIPGVLGNPESLVNESFESGILEHPQYTKPADFRTHAVPEVLLSGNHALIAKWRYDRAQADTANRRPDLLSKGLPACELNVALIHYPVLNKEGNIITSSVTNLDLHDIARSGTTFGIANYYVVHPTKALRRLSEKICEHWETGFGAQYNPNRKQAIERVRIVPDFDDVLADIEARTGMLPLVISTSAKKNAGALIFSELGAKLSNSSKPILIIFGTGWGLAPEILERADFHLEPVCGHTEYNHLSVRAAAAIIFDRLFGKQG